MKLITLVLLFVALVLSGCGGGGADTPNPLAGSYSGTWESASGQNGTATVTISTSGSVLGDITNTTYNLSGGVLKGSVDSSGNFVGTSQYPGDSKTTIRSTFVLTGSGISGNMVQTYGGVDYSGTLTLTRL
jgi:hypothetical protein